MAAWTFGFSKQPIVQCQTNTVQVKVCTQRKGQLAKQKNDTKPDHTAAGFVAAQTVWSMLGKRHSGRTDQDPAGCAPLGLGDNVGHVYGPPEAIG